MEIVMKDKSFQIKQLRVQLALLKEEASELQRAISSKYKSIANMQNEITHLIDSITVKKSIITVSDHAIIRYLERKFNLDIEAIREEILTPERLSAIKAGATKIKTDGIDFIIRDNVVVTSM